MNANKRGHQLPGRSSPEARTEGEEEEEKANKRIMTFMLFVSPQSHILHIYCLIRRGHFRAQEAH